MATTYSIKLKGKDAVSLYNKVSNTTDKNAEYPIYFNDGVMEHPAFSDDVVIGKLNSVSMIRLINDLLDKYHIHSLIKVFEEDEETGLTFLTTPILVI